MPQVRIFTMGSKKVRGRLPAICVVTGARDGVEYFPVTFEYVKNQERGSSVISLPFTRAAHAAWQKRVLAARLLLPVTAAIALVAAFIVVTTAFDGPALSRTDRALVFAIIFGVPPIAARFARGMIGVDSLGPALLGGHGDDEVLVSIPNAEAAREITRRLDEQLGQAGEERKSRLDSKKKTRRDDRKAQE
jgi:hypothetical protein